LQHTGDHAGCANATPATLHHTAAWCTLSWQPVCAVALLCTCAACVGAAGQGWKWAAAGHQMPCCGGWLVSRSTVASMAVSLLAKWWCSLRRLQPVAALHLISLQPAHAGEPVVLGVYSPSPSPSAGHCSSSCGRVPAVNSGPQRGVSRSTLPTQPQPRDAKPVCEVCHTTDRLLDAVSRVRPASSTPGHCQCMPLGT
jgi:hypothetical protein